MSEKLEQLEGAMQKAQREFYAERDRINAEVMVPKMKKLAGTHWVYRGNSYGDSLTWDVYKKILEVVEVDKQSLYMITERVQITSRGEASIVTDHDYIYLSRENQFSDGWTETTEADYNRERSRVVLEIANRDIVRKIILEKGEK